MANYTLLTASGADAPGIVAAITGVLYQNDCNIEDSQMAQLGPSFACMLMIRMPEGMVSGQLGERLESATKEYHLTIYLADLLPEQAGQTRSDAAKHLIRVRGADRKGIVHRITRHLADNRVNITNLQTEVTAGEPPLYLMTIEVELPAYTDARQLEHALVDIGGELGVRVSMGPSGEQV